MGDVDMKTGTLIGAGVVALLTLVLWAPASQAFPTYSAFKITNPDGDEEAVGNCRNCHGPFRATNAENSRPYLQDEYVSPVDDKTWNTVYQQVEDEEPELEVGLHDIHRHVMLDKFGGSRCNVCHTRPPGFYPVHIDSSTGGTGLEPISCMGCHGRDQDEGHDSISDGHGAGLRQHHVNSGVTICKACHADANPANYTPVGEDVLPSYYAAAAPDFPNRPTDPCNQKGDEDYAGGPKGLDNDGDGRYDMSDYDCQPGHRR